jgi:hypothetical protein
MYKGMILPEDVLTWPEEPLMFKGVKDYYNSQKNSDLNSEIESNNDEEAVTMLYGDEMGDIKCSLEDGLNQIDTGKYSREEVELFAMYVRSYGL